MITLFQKYKRASQLINDIISQYLFEAIERNNRIYMRTKVANLKIFHKLFKRYQYNKKIVD